MDDFPQTPHADVIVEARFDHRSRGRVPHSQLVPDETRSTDLIPDMPSVKMEACRQIFIVGSGVRIVI